MAPSTDSEAGVPADTKRVKHLADTAVQKLYLQGCDTVVVAVCKDGAWWTKFKGDPKVASLMALAVGRVAAQKAEAEDKARAEEQAAQNNGENETGPPTLNGHPVS